MIKPVIDLPPSYQLNEQFSDEFDGPFLDRGKWLDFARQWHGREPGFFDPENVTVANGCLNLTARKLKPEDVSLENKIRGYDRYSTAFVQSMSRIRFGYFETRFKSMSAAVCNAFWLHDPLDPADKYRPGNYSEEIDMFEVFGKCRFNSQTDLQPPHRIYWTTLHRFATPYVEAKVNWENTPNGSKYPVDFDFCDEFHVAGFLWDRDKLQWYLDGKLVWEQKNQCYLRPLYLNVDCEIMNHWVGLPDDGDLPSTYSLDYIRVWQKTV